MRRGSIPDRIAANRHDTIRYDHAPPTDTIRPTLSRKVPPDARDSTQHRPPRMDGRRFRRGGDRRLAARRSGSVADVAGVSSRRLRVRRGAVAVGRGPETRSEGRPADVRRGGASARRVFGRAPPRRAPAHDVGRGLPVRPRLRVRAFGRGPHAAKPPPNGARATAGNALPRRSRTTNARRCGGSNASRGPFRRTRSARGGTSAARSTDCS